MYGIVYAIHIKSPTRFVVYKAMACLRLLEPPILFLRRYEDRATQLSKYGGG